MIKAYYSRFGTIDFEEFDNIFSAGSFLKDLESKGDAFSLGVFDVLAKTFYFTDNNNVLGKEAKEIEDQIIRDMINLENTILKFDHLPTPIENSNN